MMIKKISNNKVVTAQRDAFIHDVVHLMKKHNIGNIIIIDDANKKIFLIFKEHQCVMECLEMIRAKGVRPAPVTDDSDILTGIVSTDDLILLIVGEMESYAKLVRKQLADRRL